MSLHGGLNFKATNKISQQTHYGDLRGLSSGLRN